MLTPDRWKALSPLLDEALDRTGEARVQWLTDLRSRRPSDAAEIEALLSNTAEPQLGTGALAAPVAALALQGSLVGLALGAWTLERPIGSGGMGAVWLATRNDGRFSGKAAVKLLHPSLSAGDAAARFRLEAEVLARLTHPQISRLYDAGVTPGGQPYLVLEFVDGVPIDQYCDARGASIATRVALVRQVLLAVAHAHAQGVVHRDLKPSNLLVSAEGTVTLLDFGIARLATEATGGPMADGLTQAFTPRYAAPEQVQGDIVTTASDVYAAGVLLYELLSGRHPTCQTGATTAEMLRSVVDVPPDPLPLQVPRELAFVVRRALEKQPERRYATMLAFAEDLDRVARFEPTTAHPGTALDRFGLFVRRHRAGAVAGAVVLTALAASAAVTAWQLVETRRQRDVARRAATQASVMAQVLAAGYGNLAAPDTLIDQAQRLRQIRDIVATSGAEPRLRADLLLGLATSLGRIGQRTVADSLYREGFEAAKASGDPQVVADARCAMTPMLLLTSEDAAQRMLDTARAELAMAAEPDDVVRGHCDAALATAMGMRNQMDSARALVEAALARRMDAGDSTSALYESLLETLALLGTYDRSSPAAAIRAGDRLQQVYDRTGRRFSTASVINLTEISQTFGALGEVAKSDSVASLALELLGGIAAADRAPLTLLVRLAELAEDLPTRGSPVTWYRRALQAAERGGEPNYTMRMRMALGEALIGAGDVAAARAVYDSAVREVARIGGPAQRLKLAFFRSALVAREVSPVAASRILDSVMLAHGYPDKLRMINKPMYLSRYIDVLSRAGRHAEASRALAVAAPLYATDTETGRGASHLARRALVAWGLGQRDSALVMARRALAIRRRLFKPDALPVRNLEVMIAKLERGERPPAASGR